jgi:hypothetical protein
MPVSGKSGWWSNVRKYFTNRRNQLAKKNKNKNAESPIPWQLKVMDEIKSQRLNFAEWTEHDIALFKKCTESGDWPTVATKSSCSSAAFKHVQTALTAVGLMKATTAHDGTGDEEEDDENDASTNSPSIHFSSKMELCSSWSTYAGAKDDRMNATRSPTSLAEMVAILEKYWVFLGQCSVTAEDIVDKDNLNSFLNPPKGTEKHLSNTLRLRLCYETPNMVNWSKELFREADLYTTEVSQRFQAHAENANKLRKYASQQKSKMSKGKGGQAQLAKVHTPYF